MEGRKVVSEVITRTVLTLANILMLRPKIHLRVHKKPSLCKSKFTVCQNYLQISH
jgi:hypothetical protein